MSSVWETTDGDGGGVAGKILICLLLWKNMHIHLAFRFSKGRTEEMGTCQLPYCVCVCVCMCACVCGCTSLCVCTYVCVRRPFLNDAVFIYPQFVSAPHGYHSNINDLAPPHWKGERSCVSIRPYLIYAVLNWQVGYWLNWRSGWLIGRG